MLAGFFWVTVLVIFVMSVVAHEVAHGWVAYLCGDPTAKLRGRLTFNPLPHVDPMMTILLPIFLLWISNGAFAFGGAKPVPVNPLNFRNPRRDDILVSVAGVTANFLIAIGLALLLRLLLGVGYFSRESVGTRVLSLGVVLNLLLGFFNLLPVPPLDGSRVVAAFLPARAAAAYEGLRYFGFVVVFVVIMLPPTQWLLGTLIDWTSGLLLGF